MTYTPIDMQKATGTASNIDDVCLHTHNTTQIVLYHLGVMLIIERVVINLAFICTTGSGTCDK